MNWIGQKIRKRSFNQAMNADVQGTCATMAKRSILRVDQLIRKEKAARPLYDPVHDELLWSVHRRGCPRIRLTRPAKL